MPDLTREELLEEIRENTLRIADALEALADVFDQVTGVLDSSREQARFIRIVTIE